MDAIFTAPKNSQNTDINLLYTPHPPQIAERFKFHYPESKPEETH